MLPETSKRLVEARYGRPITDEEYQAALEYATMKLNFQAELFHREFDTATSRRSSRRSSTRTGSTSSTARLPDCATKRWRRAGHTRWQMLWE